MLFPLERLIDRPEKPGLLSIQQNATIMDALRCMIENEFTQLPVVDKQGNLVGIVSEQRIMRMYYHLVEGVSLLNLTVDHCLAPAVTMPSDRDLFEALNRLKDKDVFAIIVTEGNKPRGILTDYDMTQFFRDLSEGLILVEDIEVTLRQHIEKAFPDEHAMLAALMSAFKPDRRDPSKPAKSYNELSLYDYIQLITNERNWPRFKGIFEPMDVFVRLMEPVREIRNQLAHFRGRLDSIQRDALIQALNWLERRPRAEVPKVVPVQGPPAGTSFLSDHDVNYGRLQIWLEEQRKRRGRDIRVSLQDIETLLGEPLPPSAHEHRSWWENDYLGNKHALAWMQAGWRVEDVDLSAGEVTFHRTNDVLHQLFFADALTRLKTARPGITRAEKAQAQSWWDLGAGRTGFSFDWIFSYDAQNQPVLRMELYIDTGEPAENERLFRALLDQRELIEREIGVPLQWHRLEETKWGACRIFVTRPVKITDSPYDLEHAKQWAVEMMLKFVDSFRERIRKL